MKKLLLKLITSIVYVEKTSDNIYTDAKSILQFTDLNMIMAEYTKLANAITF